jgi:ribulose-phosphate 3-epimerase
VLEDTISDIDLVLIMSVNPGFGGQSFIPASLDKIERLARMIADRRRHDPGLPEIDIAVDGGVGIANAGALVAAGARTLVAGSSVFGEPDRAAAILRLRQAAAGGPDGRA